MVLLYQDVINTRINILNEDIYNKYSKEIRLIDRVPAVFATAMGEWMYILVDEKIEKLSEMMNYIHEKKE